MTTEHDMRVRRVEKGMREELAALLGGEVKDPGAKGAIVTRVEMTNDLRSGAGLRAPARGRRRRRHASGCSLRSGGPRA